MLVKTFINGIWLPSATVLVPEVLLLDSQRKPTRKLTDLRLAQGTDFWRGGYWTAAIAFQANERFAIIYAADSTRGHHVTRSERNPGFGFMAGGNFVYVPGVGEKQWLMKYSPTGVLRISLQD